MKKHKVKHGEYVEDPKCIVCGEDVKHEWLDGDYSLLVCIKMECIESLTIEKVNKKV